MRQFYNQRIFPHILDRVMQVDSLSQIRQQLLADVQGDVVEIGFGTGLNLPFYGAGVTRLTTVDPNTGVNALALPRIAQARFVVEHKMLSAERLPFLDASVDAVVSTWTLCSIPGVASALQEVRRILKPNGVFYVAEHALSPKPNVAKWQHRLTPVQKVLADGCHLNRDMQALVQNAGFAWQQVNTVYAKGVPAIGQFMLWGRAVLA